MYETLGFEEKGDVAYVSLKRKRINVKQIRELERLCDHLDDVSTAKVVVFRGHSEGIDFDDFDPKEGLDIHGFNKWEKLVGRIEKIPKITVGLIDGPCVGGGFQFFLALDQRVCVHKAGFSLPEVRQGFLPGMAVFRLAKYVGLGHAKRIIMTGQGLSAIEAQHLGLVDVVEDDLDAALHKMLGHFGTMHPVPFSLARRLLLESYGTQYEDALGNFLAAQHRCIQQTHFLETLKREQGRH